jgi:Tfp pilus assembly protein PilO
VSRNLKLVVAVVAVFAVGFAYWSQVLGPKREEAARLDKEVAAQETTLQEAQAQLAAYERARKSYRRNYAVVTRLGKAVPADDDVRSLVVQLDAAARRSGVDFDTINLNGGSSGASATTGTPIAPGAVNAGAFSALPFSFKFTGSFGTLGNFLSRLERFVSLKGDEIAVSGRLMRVESIQLTRDEGGWPGLSAEIGASSYIVPETQAVTDAAAAPGNTTAAAGTSSTTTGTDVR